MKIQDIQTSEFIKILKITDLENMFFIYEDEFGNNFYNLNETLYFDVDKTSLSKYVMKTSGQWSLASYLIYGTTRLAWLLMKINDVKAVDMFKNLSPGDIVYYLPQDTIEHIIADLNDFDG